MTGYEFYRQYTAIKLHFSKPEYDYFRFNGQVKVTPETFEKRKDKYMFHRLARKIKSEDVVPFLVSNFIEHNDAWTRDLLSDEASHIFREWQRRNQALGYVFEQDFIKIQHVASDTDSLFKISNGNYPKVLEMYLGGELCHETMVILNHLAHIFDRWAGKISDDVIYPKIENRIRRYTPFLSIDLEQMKGIVKRCLTNAPI